MNYILAHLRILTNFYTVGDPEEPATGTADSVLSEGGIPIAVAGSLVSEGPTEMMADEMLFPGVPTGISDTLFSDSHIETADSWSSDVSTGKSDSHATTMIGMYMTNH